MVAATHRLVCRLLRPQDGFALILALGVITVLSIVGTSLMLYASDNYTMAAHSRENTSAFMLAEAGINNSLAALSASRTSALTQASLPSSLATANRSDYEDGFVKWWGVYDSTTHNWRLSATGYRRNPAVTSGYVTRTVTVSTKARADFMQPNANPVWNYIVSLRTGTPGGCDETLDNGINIASPLYVMGNLCMNTPSQITGGPLVVKGGVKLDVNTNIGTNTARVNEVHVAAGCTYKNNPTHNPCGPSDQVFAALSDSVPTSLSTPTVDLDYWYANSAPGPTTPCSSVSGTPPVFDNNSVRDTGGSVPTIFELTPVSTDYSCIARNAAGGVIGQLSWDHTAKMLTVNGTIFIDGSASINYGQLNIPIRYQGAATLYLSGTLIVKSTKLCGGIDSTGTTCDFNAWDPNKNLLVIVAMGQGGQVPTGDSISLVSSYFQGALWGGYAIDLNTSSNTEGPMIASTEIIGNTVYARTFPVLNVPAGAPGVPVTYATADPPSNYQG